MSVFRISSATAPFDTPRVRTPAVRVATIAGRLGFLPDAQFSGGELVLDMDLFRLIAGRLSSEGVAQRPARAIIEDTSTTTSASRWGLLLEDLEEGIVGSPMPRRELHGLLDTYGHEVLEALLGISPASLRRYDAGTREVPDAVAARIHFLTLVSDDLAGSYNEVGLRRWWERPRSALEGRSPREALGQDWDPDDPTAQVIAALAHALTGAGAAA